MLLDENRKALLECAQALSNLALNAVRDQAGRVRAEDALCVMGTIVAERCIDAAGEFSLRDHSIPPGQILLSETINRLLVGDIPGAEVASPSPESVFGFLFAAVGDNYPPATRPDLQRVFSGFAARVGDPANWGRVPLSVPEANRPSVLPIRVGYETRDAVDDSVARFGFDKHHALTASTAALSLLLNMVKDVIDAPIALLLSAEIINGMAKTAPMTRKAMAEVVARPSSAAQSGINRPVH